MNATVVKTSTWNPVVALILSQTRAVTGKTCATLVDEFFVVPPERACKLLPWCNTAEGDLIIIIIIRLSDFLAKLSP